MVAELSGVLSEEEVDDVQHETLVEIINVIMDSSADLIDHLLDIIQVKTLTCQII